MLRSTAGAKYKIVSGYNGTTEIGLAMERGEVVGSCGWDWASVKAQRGDWLRDKKLQRAAADRPRAQRRAHARWASRMSGTT